MDILFIYFVYILYIFYPILYIFLFYIRNLYSKLLEIINNKRNQTLSRVKSNQIIPTFYFLFVAQKKLFELPVERDFANEKAFNTAQYPFFFQIFFRIRFFDLEVRFFGTAIIKKLFIVIVGCERHLLFKTKLFFTISMYLVSQLYSCQKRSLSAYFFFLFLPFSLYSIYTWNKIQQ